MKFHLRLILSVAFFYCFTLNGYSQFNIFPSGSLDGIGDILNQTINAGANSYHQFKADEQKQLEATASFNAQQKLEKDKALAEISLANVQFLKRCDKCFGKGIDKCVQCLGRGSYSCNLCGGSGLGYNGSACGRCHGNRTLQCGFCSGLGMKNCSLCKGGGQIHDLEGEEKYNNEIKNAEKEAFDKYQENSDGLAKSVKSYGFIDYSKIPPQSSQIYYGIVSIERNYTNKKTLSGWDIPIVNISTIYPISVANNKDGSWPLFGDVKIVLRKKLEIKKFTGLVILKIHHY